MIEDYREKLSEPGQQVMPEDGDAPDFNRLRDDFEHAVTEGSDIVNQLRTNYDTRFGIWAGQSSDGKKHAREGAKTLPTPWEGASDMKALVVDEVINAKVAMKCTSFRRANLVAVPVEGTDMARAKVVGNFMKWLVHTQMPHLDREIELLAQYIEEKGFALTGQFWETCQEKTLEIITLEQLQGYFEQQGVQPDQVLAMLKEPELQDAFVQQILGAYPGTSEKKAKRMIRELVKKGETSVPVLLPEYSRPVLRTFALGEDAFISPSATDIESAPGIYRIQRYTPAQLRGFVAAEGWDSGWVEAAIEKLKGKGIGVMLSESLIGQSRGLIDDADVDDGLITVVHAYEKLTDEDGVGAVYLTVFHPELGPCEEHDGFAQFGLLGYKHGQYPFVLHRREYLSRSLHDSRGLPEVGKSFQDVIKATRDARNDAASLSVLPPLMYPQGRPPGSWGPGARVPYRRDPGEYKYADKPTYDATNTEVEVLTLKSWKEYAGVATPDGDPTLVALKQQFEVNRFLASMGHCLRQIWSLYQQFGKDEVYFRVIGVGGQDMLKFEKGDPRESFDFYLSFDSIVFDREALAEKLENTAKIVATADRYGQVDYAEYLPLLLEAIDPAISERIVLPKEAASQKAVKEYQDMFAKMFAGIDVDYQEGQPAEMGLQVLQQWVQAPEIQQRVMNKEDPLSERVEKLYKQLQFAITQRQNAQIGRLGA